MTNSSPLLIMSQTASTILWRQEAMNIPDSSNRENIFFRSSGPAFCQRSAQFVDPLGTSSQGSSSESTYGPFFELYKRLCEHKISFEPIRICITLTSSLNLLTSSIGIHRSDGKERESSRSLCFMISGPNRFRELLPSMETRQENRKSGSSFKV